MRFVGDRDRVLHDDKLSAVEATASAGELPVSFEIAGPRERLFFDPARTTAGIVTCGGLCPGLNDVIRGIVLELYHRYRATKIFGFRYGYEGLIPRYGHTPVVLRPESLARVHAFGGSILGTSRGPQSSAEMVDLLEEMNVDMLFVVGGDGSLRGASELCEEIERRGLKKSIIGIPKTIDNDIMFLDKSFRVRDGVRGGGEGDQRGARRVAGLDQRRGPGQVDGARLGVHHELRDAGGQRGEFCARSRGALRAGRRAGACWRRCGITSRGTSQAVIVVAEGAGQDLLNNDPLATDASGNRKLGDIGLFLKDRITAFFEERRIPLNLKYIDPSYLIRSVPASPQDNVYLPAPRAKRRARRDGRQDEHDRRSLALHVRPSAAAPRRARPAQDRPAR